MNEANLPVTEARSFSPRLSPRRINSVNIALTNDCNLRCTYCPIGTGKFDKSYVSAAMLEKIVDFVRRNKIPIVGLGYSGEFTKLDGWHLFVEQLLDLGVTIYALSNFSKIFAPEEIDTFSKMRAIQMSVDAADARLQRQSRRGMDLRNVVYNIAGIMAHAEKMGRPVPRFEWVCTLNDKVVAGFEDYVAFAASLGIDQIIVHQFLPFQEVQTDCQDVLQLSGAALREAHQHIVAGIEMGKRRDLEVLCQWLPLLEKKLAQSESEAAKTVSFPSILGNVANFHASDAPLSEDQAVRCTLPWDTVYIGGEGNLYPCAVSPFPLANLADAATIDELLFATKFQKWREGSLSNHPQLPCRSCPVAGRCTLEEKQQTIDSMPAFVGMHPD